MIIAQKRSVQILVSETLLDRLFQRRQLAGLTKECRLHISLRPRAKVSRIPVVSRSQKLRPVLLSLQIALDL